MTADTALLADQTLLADVGGTNARFALLAGDEIRDIRTLATADHDGLKAAIHAYLGPRTVSSAAIAVAGPLPQLDGGGDYDGEIAFTNRAWSFVPAALRQDLRLRELHVVNDFVAQALALPHLGATDIEKIGGGEAAAGAPMGILGPGTGLGAAFLVEDGDLRGGHGRGGAWRPLSTEGGHVTLAASTDEEDAVLRLLRGRMGHVSAEKVLSGMGMEALYAALATLDGEPAEPDAVTITRAAIDGTDARAVRTIAMFFEFLGTVASDFALTVNARGGIYIGGGIVPRFGPMFAASGFRRRFETKGRFSAYLAAIPTYVVTARDPAFLGLRALVRAGSGEATGPGR